MPPVRQDFVAQVHEFIHGSIVASLHPGSGSDHGIARHGLVDGETVASVDPDLPIFDDDLAA